MHAFARYRDQCGLSQAALAAMLKVSAPSITHYETGKRRVTAERAIEFEGLLQRAFREGKVPMVLTRHDLRPDIFGPAPNCPCRESAA